MIDWTKPVQTKDGRPVEIVTTKARFKDFPIYGYVGNDDVLTSWPERGSIYRNLGPCVLDLINVPETKTYYGQLGREGYNAIYFFAYPHSESEATHKITLAPGQPPKIEGVK